MESTKIKERAVTAAEEIAELAADKLKEKAAEEHAKLILPAERRVGFLDRIQEKLASRKLIVFITATVLMWYGLDPETWGLIAMCYIGGQSAIDMVKVWKWG